MTTPTTHEVGPLPTEIAKIDADLLTAGLSPRFPGVRLAGIGIEEVHHGFSTILRVRLDPAPDSRAADLPASVIFKGGFEAGSRNRGRDYTYMSLEMEHHSYRMLPELGLNVPAVFGSYLDPEHAQMMLLMEDLALRGVDFQNGLRPNRAEQVRRRITALADFHARTWDSPELDDGGQYAILPTNGARMFLGYMDHAGFDRDEWVKYLALPRGMACPVQYHDYDWLRRTLEYAAQMSDALPNCIVHGDTHLGNLYEESDGTPGFFDSLARREAGIMEVTYHICNAMDPVDRRRHERELIAHYRDALIRNGVKVGSLADVMHQYATFLVINYVTFIVNETTYQTESFNTVHAVRAAVAMMDNDTYDVV
jgi:hypothetical protein